MADENIVNSAHIVKNPTVRTPARAYNGNTADWASMEEAAIGGVAELILGPFTITTPAPQRGDLFVDVTGQWGTADAFDKFLIFFGLSDAGPWVLIDVKTAQLSWQGALGGPLVKRTFNLSAFIGAASVFYIFYQFFNGSSFTPDPPDPGS